MKFCRWCQTEKTVEEFYKHKAMKDGYLNKCKVCCYAEQKVRRATPEGKEARKREKQYPENKRRYKKTEKGQIAAAKQKRRPDREAAKNAVAYAIRMKRLIPQPCELCGKKAEAHHWSYLPEHRLDVKWLCRFHHNEEHRRLDQRKSWVS
jgi:hypothetical protein